MQITDVDSTGLPDTPLLGSELTLTATVQLAGLGPTRSWCRPCWAASTPAIRCSTRMTVAMTHTGTGEGGVEIFSTTAPLPVAGSVGYTVRVLPHNDLLAADNELGLVRLA